MLCKHIKGWKLGLSPWFCHKHPIIISWRHPANPGPWNPPLVPLGFRISLFKSPQEVTFRLKSTLLISITSWKITSQSSITFRDLYNFWPPSLLRWLLFHFPNCCTLQSTFWLWTSRGTFTFVAETMFRNAILASYKLHYI